MFKGGLHHAPLTRVPFIWRDPARPGGGQTVEALTQTTDIALTVLARAWLASADNSPYPTASA
ncbi:hypothetical protein [Hydrogenophaga sp.]|uniref:hypothetical protein n=1 Tax=Hydrogenophaga sp. TaxID=1904254 RepID=UPI00286E04F6|nr:hypothetical protein [Hydrogenophaga sp.]